MTLKASRRLLAALAASKLVAVGFASPSAAQTDDKPNDGTDPTRPVRTMQGDFEYLDLAQSRAKSKVFTGSFAQPFGRTSIQVKAPLASLNVNGDQAYALGDVSVKYTRVFGVTPREGYVFTTEVFFDTAERPELGSGKYVVKPTLIYARFLRDGAIFAPALVQSVSVAGRSSRADVNTTTIDFYYVPRLANPRLYMTYDPAVNYDWEQDDFYAALAVTLGLKLGQVLGGSGQVFIRPSTTFGDQRPVDWGIKAGFQLLNF
jgi:hypothetical protein